MRSSGSGATRPEEQAPISPRAVISLGSNIEPERNLPAAMAHLVGLGQVTRVSRVYASPAVGPPGQPDFLNAAVSIETEMTPGQLRSRLRRIESALGRARSQDKYAARPIDIDLVLYDDLLVDSGTLRLPDPDLLTRAHLAVTVAELAPERRHPLTGETLGTIAGRLAPSAQLTARPDVVLGAAPHEDRRGR